MLSTSTPAMRTLLFAAVAAFSLPLSAQTFGSVEQDAPLDAPVATALGMGNAVAAVPAAETAFFANPAHLTSVDGLRLSVLGLGGGLGGNVIETLRFYRDDLGPAIEDGFGTMRESDPEGLRDLYDEALRIGQSQKTIESQGELLALQLEAGPVSVGTGLFASGTGRAQIIDGGAGIPYLDTYSQVDALVPVTAAMEVPGTPLSVGASATWVQRRVTAKADFVEALDPDGEKLYLLSGTGLAFGAGVVAHDALLPGLDLGASVTSIGSGVDLTFDRSWAISGSDDTADDAAEIATLEARFDGRGSVARGRFGAAYRLPVALAPGVDGATVSADWVSGSTSEFDQSLQAGLRVGAQVRLAKVLELRAGLAQGYPSVGASLDLRYVRLDYATYGVEDGRLLGQLGRRTHLLQLRLGVL